MIATATTPAPHLFCTSHWLLPKSDLVLLLCHLKYLPPLRFHRLCQLERMPRQLVLTASCWSQPRGVCSRRSAEKKSSVSHSHSQDEITSHARSGTAASFLPDFLGQKTLWGMCTEPHSVCNTPFSHNTNSGAAELRLRRSSLKGPLWNIWPDFWFFFFFFYW